MRRNSSAIFRYNIKMHKLLITTPTLTSGSWVVIENLLPFLEKEFEINIVGLGEGRSYKNIKITKIPYKSFETMNPKLGSNIFYNILYQFPLQLTNFYKLLSFDPQYILSNGFGPLIAILPLAKLLNKKVIVYYGSHLGVWLDKKYVLFLAKILNNFIDLMFVNSKDSLEDALRYIDIKKIKIIEHTTNFSAFTSIERENIRSKYNLKKDDFVIMLANRLVPSKNLPTLLLLINKIINDNKSSNIKFFFAGEGTMLNDVLDLEKKHPDRIKYLGKFGQTDKEALKEWLTAADLIWTNAETTYMSIGGVEALAVGTPIIISNEIYHQTRIVPKDLIPEIIGWVVDHNDIDKMADLIEKIAENRLTDKMRAHAKLYALEKFSTKNLENAVELIKNVQKV